MKGETKPPPSSASALQQRRAAGYALPATWYSSSEIFEIERLRIFARSWQLNINPGRSNIGMHVWGARGPRQLALASDSHP